MAIKAKTEIKIIIGVAVASVLLFTIGMLASPEQQPQTQTLPWQIEHTSNGRIKVFGLIVGKSNLQEAENSFQHHAKVNLFESINQERSVEAYFDQTKLGGLSAEIVLVLDFSDEQLQFMYERGVRISTLGSGTHKVTLHDKDIDLARRSTIRSITYIPRIHLNNELIIKRFGVPQQRLSEPDSDTTHWLYPHMGLDLAVDKAGNAVLQYITPNQFSLLTQPLAQHANSR